MNQKTEIPGQAKIVIIGGGIIGPPITWRKWVVTM
jgi:hypothetical protein